MIDFLAVSTKRPKKDVIEIFPKFIIKRSSDLMIRGGDFYAVWVEERGLWSTDEQDALQLIDEALKEKETELQARYGDGMLIKTLYMWDADSGSIDSWHKYCQKQMRDNFHMLDEKLIFSNSETNKKDYASKRLSYPLEEGETPAWDKIMSTLYLPEERHKIEWAIGAIVTGDSKKIQKFLVLYGAAGTGKSTVLNIIQQLFEGYYSVFDAKALGSANSQFALEAFKTNPLVAIQHDGDLSRIEDNTRLNSLVSHELMTVNEKFKSTYANRFKAFLFMGTNKPVKITDAKSGLIRRLIDVTPSGNKLSPREYKTATKQVAFELGAIAYHCREVYLADPDAYDAYTPVNMMGASNDFYNFVLDSYYIFKKEDGTTMKTAWEMYKTYCEDAKVPYPYSQRLFKEELKNYFREYEDRVEVDGARVRSYFRGFRSDKFEPQSENGMEKNPGGEDSENKCDSWLAFRDVEGDAKDGGSIFDRDCSDCLAQYANEEGTPKRKWENVRSKLPSLDTSKLHYVKVPENHIVIDFDILGPNGEKDFERNLEAASKWPATYAELSKSGAGIHLHYIYNGDVSKLSHVYDDHIEVKIFTGKSSLRRKLTKCNNLPIATISSGLPMKGEKKMINFEGVMNEKGLRTFIKRALNKEYHPNTKPSIDYIYKKLEETYDSGQPYDVTDMRNAVLAFAAGSSHQADYCIKLVNKMRFKSEEQSKNVEDHEAPIVFFDCEVFPNLFLVNWKFQGEGKPVVRMINPKPSEIEELLRFRLIGFNNRRYDNHMLYARLIGYSEKQLFDLSQKIVMASKGEGNRYLFGEAFNLSYTDVYDFAANKQGLKKWEIELGIHHKELGLPWDEPVPEERWIEVAEYCDNDVLATEAVFNHLKGDWTARQILADLAGMTVNDTTNQLTTRIIFGKEKKPKLVYTDLATGRTDPPEWQRDDIITAFPGYEFKDGKNMFRGDDLGKGGYVYAEPGIYRNVALLDIASLHPNSIRAMNCFGEYTKNFTDILDARVCIKHRDYDSVRHMFGGKLAGYLTDESTAKDLAQALKIAINSVYGLTSANFDNPFRDIRNKNNIVALRGALFMRTLQDEVKERGFTVAHIKTDSIKIPNATPEIIQFCMDFAKKYGYTFEHEATYDRMCLVNNAVYIARYEDKDNLKGEWTATGTQFQVPYVFKKLFSREEIKFEDLCETKQVAKGALYLDMNENLPDVSEAEKIRALRRMPSDQISKSDYNRLNEKSSYGFNWSDVSDEELDDMITLGHSYIFVGRVGQFCPIKPGANGGELVVKRDDKYVSAAGAKDYRWLESETVRVLGKEDSIDRSYYDRLVDDAIDAISEYGDFYQFVAEDTPEAPPWFNPDEPWCDERTQFDVR